MTTIFKKHQKQGLKSTSFTTAFAILLSFSTIGQAISNPTVLNSMGLSNVTPTSATLSWLYRSDEFDSAPVYVLYSKTSSQTFYKSLASAFVNATAFTSTPQSQSLNVTGLQPNTTYTWFLNVLDEATGMSEPLVTDNFNNGVFLGLSILTTSTYQLITFTTPNTNGTGGSSGVVTTVTGTIPPNQLPVANAGADLVLPFGATSVTLNALGSTDNDGGIRSFSWGRTAGPSVFAISSYSSPTPTLTNLTTGTYTFQLTITDSRFATSRDFVTIEVNSGNQLPIVNAGPDQTITLPTNTITLNGSATDPDGTIANVYWTVVSGPGIYGLTTPNSPTSALLRNLQQGTYTLELKATDNLGSSSTDTVIVTVNPSTTPCTNDNFEPNNTNSSAAAINAGSTIQAKICPLTDVDFFSFNNRNNQRNIRVTLSRLPANYVLELFAPNGNLIGTSNAANTQNKVIVHNTTTVGTYKIKVSAGVGAIVTNNSYSLLAETKRNNFSQAARLQSSQTNDTAQTTLLKNNGLPTSAFDIYPNPATGNVQIKIPANESYSNISVFNLSGQLVKTANAQKNINSLNVADLGQGIYLVKVITISRKIFSKKITVIR